MQAYALARPAVRFSLRILKAKNDKGGWLYAPKADASVEDAAIKVVGKDCASQCAWYSTEHEGFIVEGFLPRQQADMSKVNNFGSFISVDSRPVVATRGFLKKMATLFKDRLREKGMANGDVKDPFFVLIIACPSQSYDPNVEPAKDDVLFEDSDQVLNALEKLLDICYPVKSAAPVGSPSIFLDDVLEEAERPAKRSRTDIRNGTCDVDDDSSMLDQPQGLYEATEEGEEDEINLRDATIFNPWTMAKLTSSMHVHQHRNSAVAETEAPSSPNCIEHPQLDITPKAAYFPPYPPWALPTPESSSPLVCSAQRHDLPTGDLQSASPNSDRASPKQYLGWRRLPLKPTENQPQNLTRTGHDSARPNDFVSALEVPLGTPWEPESLLRQSTRRQATGPRVTRAAANATLLKRSVPPVRNPSEATEQEQTPNNHHVARDGDIRAAFGSIALSQDPLSLQPHKHKRPRRAPVDPYEDLEDDLSEVDSRFYPGAASRRQPRVCAFNGPGELPPNLDPSPRRQTTQLRPTPPLSGHAPNTPAPSEDPTPPRTRRARTRTCSSTAHLPLESIPAGDHLHNLSLTISASLASLSALAEELKMTLRHALPVLPRDEWDVLTTLDEDDEEDEEEDGEAGDGSAEEDFTAEDKENTPRMVTEPRGAKCLDSEGKRRGEIKAFRGAFTDPPPSAAECDGWRESIGAFLRLRGDGYAGDEPVGDDVQSAVARLV